MSGLKELPAWFGAALLAESGPSPEARSPPFRARDGLTGTGPCNHTGAAGRNRIGLGPFWRGIAAFCGANILNRSVLEQSPALVLLKGGPGYL
jgi:hypothetical protein